MPQLGNFVPNFAMAFRNLCQICTAPNFAIPPWYSQGVHIETLRDEIQKPSRLLVMRYKLRRHPQERDTNTTGTLRDEIQIRQDHRHRFRSQSIVQYLVVMPIDLLIGTHATHVNISRFGGKLRDLQAPEGRRFSDAQNMAVGKCRFESCMRRSGGSCGRYTRWIDVGLRPIGCLGPPLLREEGCGLRSPIVQSPSCSQCSQEEWEVLQRGVERHGT